MPDETMPVAGDLGAAAHLSPPPMTAITTPPEPEGDPWGWGDRPGAPLPEQMSRSRAGLVCDAPRLNDGLLYLGKVADALGWVAGQDLAVELEPDQGVVVLRPAHHPLSDRSGLTLGMAADLLSEVDGRRRVRLAAGALTTLGVARNGGQVIAFGRRLPKAAPSAPADRTAVWLVGAHEVEPLWWTERLSW